jgi:hypothetical protein
MSTNNTNLIEKGKQASAYQAIDENVDEVNFYFSINKIEKYSK